MAFWTGGEVSFTLYSSVGLPLVSAFVSVRVSVTEQVQPEGDCIVRVCVVSFEKALVSIVPCAPPRGMVMLMAVVSGTFPFASVVPSDVIGFTGDSGTPSREVLFEITS